jgi:hypothetical protein
MKRNIVLRLLIAVGLALGFVPAALYWQMLLLLIFLSIIMIWQLVLRTSAYPHSVPSRLKIIHALIILFVTVYAWSGVSQFIWHLLHIHSGDWSSPILMFGFSCWGMAGGCLLFVCYGMAIRIKSTIRWFFVLWPVTFLSYGLVIGVRFKEAARTDDFVQGGILWIGIFILTLAFYLPRFRKLIFEEVDNVANTKSDSSHQVQPDAEKTNQ